MQPSFAPHATVLIASLAALAALVLHAPGCAGASPQPGAKASSALDPASIRCPGSPPAPELAIVEPVWGTSQQDLIGPPPAGAEVQVERGLGTTSSPRLKPLCGWVLNRSDAPVTLAIFPGFFAYIEGNDEVKMAGHVRHGAAGEPPPPRLLEVPARSKVRLTSVLDIGEFNWKGTPQAKIRWSFSWGTPVQRRAGEGDRAAGEHGDFLYTLPPADSVPHDPPGKPRPTLIPG